MRVLDRARTLQVAVWLHQLDMAMGGDQSASEALDASRHCLGRLLESFLIPTTHNLMFREVAAHCLYKNRRDAECHLNDLVKHHNRICKELDDLMEAHREASGSSRRKQTFDIRSWRASRDASPMRSPTFRRTRLSRTHLRAMTPLTSVPKW